MVILTLIGVSNAHAQLQLKHMPGMNNGGYVPQRVCFEITNNGIPQQSIISIKVKSVISDSVVLEMESSAINIIAGNMQILPGHIEQFKVLGVDGSYFTGPLNLKQGNYITEIVIRHKNEDFEMGYTAIPFSVTQQSKNNGQKSKIFSTSGSGQVTGVLSTRQQSYSGMPQNYAQATLDPSVTLYGVPVSAHVTLSSAQQTGLAQNLNTFSVNYNNDALMALLKSKLTDALEKNADFKKLNDLKESAEINKYLDYKKTLENPNVIKELAQLAHIDTLAYWKDSLAQYKKMYQELSLIDTLNGLHKQAFDRYADTTTALKEMYKRLPVDSSKIAFYRDSIGKVISQVSKLVDTYNTLKAKKEGYEKLIKNKEELEKKLKNLGLIDSLGNDLKGKAKGVKNKIDDVKQNLDNPQYFTEQLKQNQLLRPLDKVMLAINKINIGTSYPVISPLTLNGVRVNGVNVELTPKNIFAAFTYGTVIDPIQSYNLSQATYKRKIWSSTIGYGSPETSHLFFTAQNATDDSTSISPRDSIFVTVKLPQANYVLSTHFKLQLFENRFTVFGELAGSQTVRDVKLNNPDSSTYTTIATSAGDSRKWVQNILTQRKINSNTIADYAYTGGIEFIFFKGKTKLTNTVKRIGSNFQTFGVPFLINDMLTIEGKLAQKIWKSRIVLGATLKHNTDNLNGLKLATTRNLQFGGDIRIAIPKWPTLRAGYIPVMMQNDSVKVAINILNLNMKYQYKIARVKNIVSAAYIKQNLTSTDSLLNYSSVNALLSHTTFFHNGISVMASANYIRFSNVALPNINTINISLSTGFGLFKKKLTNTLGATIIKNENEFKYGFFYYGSMPVGKFLTANIRLENNQYNSFMVNQTLAIPYFSEFICQLSLAVKW